MVYKVPYWKAEFFGFTDNYFVSANHISPITEQNLIFLLKSKIWWKCYIFTEKYFGYILFTFWTLMSLMLMFIMKAVIQGMNK